MSELSERAQSVLRALGEVAEQPSEEQRSRLKARLLRSAAQAGGTTSVRSFRNVVLSGSVGVLLGATAFMVARTPMNPPAESAVPVVEAGPACERDSVVFTAAPAPPARGLSDARARGRSPPAPLARSPDQPAEAPEPVAIQSAPPGSPDTEPLDVHLEQPDTLLLELEAIREVDVLLRIENPAGALRALAGYDLRFGQTGVLGVEATTLRALGLCMAGQFDAGAALLGSVPRESPYSARVDAACTPPSSP